ncbi:MAG: hypothetical protein ACKODX_12095 [Gemmata sp.]
MATATTQPPTGTGGTMPKWAEDEWQTAYLRVKGTAAALRLWDRVLTAEDRRRLGGDLEAAYARHRGAVGMWRHLRGVSLPRAVVDVGVRIGFLDADSGRVLLRVIGEEPDDPQEALEMAVAGGGLVLVEVSRQVHWEKGLVELDWGNHTAWWSFLWELARASKAGAAVDEYTLRGGSSKDPKYLTKQKSRMVKAGGLPPTLAALVVPAGRGTYRLDLQPARIRVFERGAGDSLREWTP